MSVIRKDESGNTIDDNQKAPSVLDWLSALFVSVIFMYFLFLGFTSIFEYEYISKYYCEKPIKRIDLLFPNRLIACKIYEFRNTDFGIEEWLNKEIGYHE